MASKSPVDARHQDSNLRPEGRRRAQTPDGSRGWDEYAAYYDWENARTLGTVVEEIWRVLKDHGRLVVSDIVSDREVPPHLKVNPRLWGECLVAALTEEAFISGLERVGFQAIEVLRTAFWKEVEGYAFRSVTVRG